MKVVITIQDLEGSATVSAVAVRVEPPPIEWPAIDDDLTPAGHVAAVAFSAISEYLKLMCSDVANPYENLQ